MLAKCPRPISKHDVVERTSRLNGDGQGALIRSRFSERTVEDRCWWWRGVRFYHASAQDWSAGATAEPSIPLLLTALALLLCRLSMVALRVRLCIRQRTGRWHHIAGEIVMTRPQCRFHGGSGPVAQGAVGPDPAAPRLCARNKKPPVAWVCMGAEAAAEPTLAALGPQPIYNSCTKDGSVWSLKNQLLPRRARDLQPSSAAP